MRIADLRPAAGERVPRGFRRDLPLFDRLLPLLLAGYILLDRGFAWLHIPGTPIFVSEIVIAFGLTGALRAISRPRVWEMSSVVSLVVLFVVWGMARTLPGLFDNTELALRDAATWVYALIAFAIIDSLWNRPAALGRWLAGYSRLFPLIVLWLPLSAMVADRVEGFTVPDSTVSLFSYKPGNAAVHLILVIAALWALTDPRTASGSRKRYMITGVAVIGVLVLSTQGRGGFVAAAVAGAFLLVLTTDRSKVLLAAVASLVLVAVVVVIVDPEVNVGGREISADQLTENIASIVQQEGQGELGGNIQWRLHHWGTVWDGVNTEAPLVGHGFPSNLAEMYEIPQADIGLRNAHNSHLTILARMGWVGAGIWVLIWGFWFREMAVARRRFLGAGLERLAGLVTWAMLGVIAIQVNAIFDPTLEGPQVALWLWAIAALGIYLGMVSRPGRIPGAHGRASAETLDDVIDQALRRAFP